jgi:hypothetical protein
METARSLARRETEKAAFAHLAERRAAALQLEQAKRDKNVGPRLDEIARTLDRLEQQADSVRPGSAEEAAVLGPLADTQRTLTDLASDLALSGESHQSRARSFDQRLDAVRNRLDRRHLQVRLEDAITDAIADSPGARGFRNPAEFATAIQGYAKAFPELPRGRACTATLREQPLWDAVAEWDRLATGWKSDRMMIAPQEAKVRAEQCRQFLVQHPGSPDSDRIAAYQKSMEAVARRGADADGAVFKLQRLLSDLLVDNLWMVTAKPPAAPASKRYYLTQKPASDARTIHYLVGFDGKEHSAKMVAAWVEGSDVAPQSKVAAKFKPIFFQDPARIDWEAEVVDLLDRIRIQPEMDPVLQVALLRKVLELGVDGSEPLREALSAFKNLVDQADLDVTVAWMDPDNKDADRMRAKAVGVVRSFPDLVQPRKEALNRRSQIERQMVRRPRTIGWLARETEGWRVRTGSSVPPRGTLWVVIPGDAGRGAWHQIGTIDQAKPFLSLVDDPALAEGRPVFARPPEGDES